MRQHKHTRQNIHLTKLHYRDNYIIKINCIVAGKRTDALFPAAAFKELNINKVKYCNFRRTSTRPHLTQDEIYSV